MGFPFCFDVNKKRKTLSACRPFDHNETPWGHRGLPDKIHNPFQEQTGFCAEYKTMWAMTDKIDWLEEYNGKQGVWRLNVESGDFSSIDFNIPNDFLRHTDIKLTQVQVTYSASNNYPIVKILILLPEDTEDYIFILAKNEYQSAILPDGWRQHTYIFETDYCPSFENIKILPPDNRELFIDSVVIDTVCREKK